jgi:precorrin-6x reductase
MKYDTIVIAGTTESREVIARELLEGHRVLACVATDLGAEMLDQYHIDVHIGRLDEAGFLRLFQENPCDRIIDASHPFAQIVTKTVRSAAARMNIPYERYERRETGYDYEGIIYVSDASEAVRQLNEISGPVLLTTGVNTAAVYAEGVKDAKERLYIRVLDNEASYAGCEKAGYPADHVFGEMPPFSVEDNLRLIKKTRARVLVSKDSGKSGGVDVKVEACREAGITMILIRRP